ncbi:helix-turn-helix domain-containing protein [Candidatus Pacearchaeota archaeon]|nr:helix-turn-helix domain-containing protein [Candidatus Pacearchaeota archaeon]
MENISKYLTVKEVSKKLGVTEKWIRDLIQAKQLKATKIKHWRIYPKDLEKFIKRRRNM